MRTVAMVLIVSVAFALAIAMVVAHQAAGERVQTATSDLGTQVEIDCEGCQGGVYASGSPLSSTDVDEIAATPHVVSVATYVRDSLTGAGSTSYGSGGTTSLTSPLTFGSIAKHFHFGGGGFGGGGFGGGYGGPSPDTPLAIAVIGTDDPLDPTILKVTSAKIVRGSAVDGSSSADVADVGTSLAAKNALNVGSTFTAYGTPIKVVGIYQTNDQVVNAGLLLPLKTEQTLSGIDGVQTVFATVDSLGNVQSVASSIQKELGSSTANVVTSQSDTTQLASDLNSIKTVSMFSLIGAAIAAIAILLMSMLMIVRERRREIGILKAFGSSNGGVVSSFVTEAITITLCSAVVGTLIGIIISNPILSALKNNNSAGGPGSGRGGFAGGGFGGHFNFGAGSFLRGDGLSQLHAVFGTGTVAFAVLIAVGIALVGSAVPAFVIAKIRPAEVLRSE